MRRYENRKAECAQPMDGDAKLRFEVFRFARFSGGKSEPKVDLNRKHRSDTHCKL